MTHRPNSLGHQKPYHCFGSTYLFVTCHSHYLQVKFQQYPTTFHILLCLSMFIYAFGIYRMPFLAYLPRAYDPIERANMSLCMAQRLITPSLNTSAPCILIYLILHKIYLICVTPPEDWIYSLLIFVFPTSSINLKHDLIN